MEEQARARLREGRSAAKLSVRELSRRIGISPSMLSQIENGHSEPSVATLYALVSALSMSIDDILSAHAPVGRQPAAGTSPVLRADDRERLEMDSGVCWERLTAGTDPLVEALLVTYPPRSSSSSNGGLMRHGGREYGYLLEGELTVQVGFETFVLRPGDTVTFDSATPHLYRNDSSKTARGIWHVVSDGAPGDPGEAGSHHQPDAD